MPLPAARPTPSPAAAIAYDRLRDLPRLLRMWPNEVVALGEADRARLVERLRQMLRAELQRDNQGESPRQ